MMDILKTVGQIAGIGGLALGVFLILFREVIRRKIFPELPKPQAYKLLRLIIILVFIVTIVGIGAWVYVETAPKPIEDTTRLQAEFVLDEKGNPQIIGERTLEYGTCVGLVYDYKIRVSLENIPPGVTDVTYDPGDSTFDDIFLGSGSNFKAEFNSYGDLNIIVNYRKDGVVTKTNPKNLIAALEQTYKGEKKPEILNALKQFRKC